MSALSRSSAPGCGGGRRACRRRRSCRSLPRASPRRTASGARRGLGDDPVDGRLEAHVEHPVGLVEDEDLDLVERDDAAGDQVLEPAGGGDEDVGAAGGGDLRAEADAAVDGGDTKPAGGGDGAQLIDDLAGQLAGGGEDQGRAWPGARLDALDQRDAEGERLARAGRGLDEQVVAGERVAETIRLDGEGLGDVAARERADHRFGDAEIGKRSDVVSSFLSDWGRSSGPRTPSGTEETEPLGWRRPNPTPTVAAAV